MARFSVEAIFKAVDRITAPISRIQNNVGRATKSMQRGLDSVNKSISKVGGALADAGKFALKWAAIGIGAVTAGVTLLIREFSKIEDAEAAFTPLLGSVARAKELVAALNKTAATTPFQFEELADQANTLLPVMNGNIEKTIKTIRMLGDTSGGNAQKLDSITRGFTKAMLKGKVDLESLNMIAEAGVPIFTELAASMGKKVGPAFFKMISAGKVGTAQLEKAFERMTSSGGVFFNGMEIASQTTSGLWSSFLDSISMAAAELGSTLAPTIKELIKMATQMAERLREWVGQNKELISEKVTSFFKQLLDFGVRIVQNWDAITAKAQKWGTIAAVILGIVVALKAFAAILTVINLVMAANPITLIIMGIVAVVTILIFWFDEFIASIEKVGEFLISFGSPIAFIINGFVKLIDVVKEALEWMGVLDDTDVDVNSTRTNVTEGPLIASPQARIAQAIENKSVSTAELFIRDETGRAELKAPSWMPGASIKLQPSGSF